MKYGFGLWGVVLKKGNQFIGDCGIAMQNINGKTEPEIGCHTSKNYATEAAQACRNYAFEDLKLRSTYSLI